MRQNQLHLSGTGVYAVYYRRKVVHIWQSLFMTFPIIAYRCEAQVWSQPCGMTEAELQVCDGVWRSVCACMRKINLFIITWEYGSMKQSKSALCRRTEVWSNKCSDLNAHSNQTYTFNILLLQLVIISVYHQNSLMATPEHFSSFINWLSYAFLLKTLFKMSHHSRPAQ